ncbi:MAG: sigma-70 family RNA polymerase sigma factor [Lachnospiraceae bacterium]|nr:sigma-70 family RNA polymerase sigma factor [Lachnospiraceae bacterium]
MEHEREIHYLYEESKEHLHAIANGVLGDDMLAEDVVQDIFVDLLKDEKRMEGLLARDSIDYLSKRTKERATSRQRTTQKEVPISSKRRLGKYQKKEVMIDTTSLVEVCFEQLREDDKWLLRARYLWGYSEKEMAMSENISYPTLRKRMQRARKQLKKLILMEVESKYGPFI